MNPLGKEYGTDFPHAGGGKGGRGGGVGRVRECSELKDSWSKLS